MEIGHVVAKKFRLTRQIGRGGMGAVFEAAHVSTGERVAVKVMHAAQAGEEAADARLVRFQREAIAVGRLATQHVTQVYEAGIDDETREPFIVMELLEGEDLSQLIKRVGPLRLDLALAIVAQACAGLAKAHEAGVIHRDIKPGNLFLARNGRGERIVKVLDFGIAKVQKTDQRIGSELGTITETGTLVGSPHYMSPEQATGLKTVDPRADIWSLGIVLHKCLSGRTPFDNASTLGQVILAVCSEQVVPVTVHAPWVPPEVAALVAGALRRNVQERFQSSLALRDAVRQFLPNGEGITDDMLEGVSAELRMTAPARADGVPDSTPFLPMEGVPPPRSGRPAPTGAGLPPSSAGSVSLTGGGFSETHTTLESLEGKRSRISVAVVGVALFGVVAVGTLAAGVLARMNRHTDATHATAPPSSSSPEPPLVLSVPSTATASASATIAASASASAGVASTSLASTSAKPRPSARVAPSAAAASSARTNGPGRLQGGIGSDVPF